MFTTVNRFITRLVRCETRDMYEFSASDRMSRSTSTSCSTRSTEPTTLPSRRCVVSLRYGERRVDKSLSAARAGSTSLRKLSRSALSVETRVNTWSSSGSLISSRCTASTRSSNDCCTVL